MRSVKKTILTTKLRVWKPESPNHTRARTRTPIYSVFIFLFWHWVRVTWFSTARPECGLNFSVLTKRNAVWYLMHNTRITTRFSTLHFWNQISVSHDKCYCNLQFYCNEGPSHRRSGLVHPHFSQLRSLYWIIMACLCVYTSVASVRMWKQRVSSLSTVTLTFSY